MANIVDPSKEKIYTGLWINWTFGEVFGATLTLEAGDAAILNAFIAVLLSFAGNQLWKVLVHVFHQARYRRACVDGLEHQERVILRNSNNPGTTAWYLLQQAWFWRSSFRTLPLATFASLYIVAVATLSVLVPAHLYADPTRLLVPTRCELLRVDDMSNEDFNKMMLKQSQESSLHSQNCYEPATQRICQGYPVIDTIFTRNTSCPFDPKICSSRAVPITMTSRLIDSREDLGINLPERISYRTAITCSILSSVNHVREVNDTETNGGYLRKYYEFGPIANVSNYTFSYNTMRRVSEAYDLYVMRSYQNEQHGIWDPIPELQRTDADVIIILFHPNGVTSGHPIDDPLFATHTSSNETFGDDSNYYIPDFDGVPIGCISQHQLCNPRTGACSQLRSPNQTYSSSTASEIGLSKAQFAILGRVSYTSFWSGLDIAIGSRSGAALRASATVQQNTQLGLPNDQYLREMQSWYTTGIASSQLIARSYVATTIGGNSTYNMSRFERSMCFTQRTPDTGSTVSFSFFRFIMVIIVCVGIVMFSFFTESFVGWVQKRIHLESRTATALWKLDDVLQLQRFLFEGLGYGKWTNSSWIPITLAPPFGEIDHRRYKDPRFTEHVIVSPEEDAGHFEKGFPSSATSEMLFKSSDGSSHI